MGYAGLFAARGEKAKARQHLSKAKTSLNTMGIRMWDWQVAALEQQLGE
ncbi:hypothetical protein GWN42_32315 [candidate division KSB1 bacterium]|nr:hypothetical protein [candidate division KSB1 bacterium]NIV97352.1 hypothetical protein [candidate division KSB1 bacterium]NIW21685.1 hypothetical protein [candidate division KSB1 bacterium]NIW72109.1 hypothetical protein [candidate division KSB1 bacterium]